MNTLIYEEQKVQETIEIKMNEVPYLLIQEHIEAIMSIKDGCFIYYENEVFLCGKTLREILKELNPTYFLQCHKRYVVNVRKIKETKDGDVYLRCSKKIRVSRRYKKILENMMLAEKKNT